ncbi:MAG: FAD-dependent monooxygenase [Xanthomonadales bacterium]|nr:FAD-dependent monooxygenase [Xanthomonadales bacterium]
MRPSRPRVAIVGYGTAGQACAILLSRDGWGVDVFEQSETTGPVGAGFLLQPVGLQVLWDMGLLDAALAHGRRIERLHGETSRGRAVMDMRYAQLDPRLFGLGMQRGALFALLDRAWSGVGAIRLGHRIVAISEDGRHVRDGEGRSHGPYDLVVAADGSASRLRAVVGRARLDAPYPWGALWCLVPEGRWPHRTELRQRYRAARRMIGMLPVGTRPDDEVPRISFFWSQRRDDHARWLADGMEAWRGEVASLWPEIAEHLAGIVDPGQLARAGYRDAVLDDWRRGRLVLVGDAAHAMSPQLGQGVNMALLDAFVLRAALRTHARIDDALAAYQRERQRHVRVYQFWSRWLTPLFQSDRDVVARLRDLAFLPLGRLPGSRGQMLHVLGGTRLGAFGRLRLSSAFLDGLGLRTRLG